MNRATWTSRAIDLINAAKRLRAMRAAGAPMDACGHAIAAVGLAARFLVECEDRLDIDPCDVEYQSLATEFDDASRGVLGCGRALVGLLECGDMQSAARAVSIMNSIVPHVGSGRAGFGERAEYQ